MKRKIAIVVVCGCIALSPLVSFGTKETAGTGTQSVNDSEDITSQETSQGTKATQVQNTDTEQGQSNGSESTNQETIQNQNQSGEKAQNQNQEQEQIKDGESENKNDSASQNQKTVQNQEKIRNQEQYKVGGTKEEKAQRSQERRSQIANAVQEIEKIAENNQGIGEQIRTIAQNQKDEQDVVEDSLEEAQERNSVIKFLIGANYGKLKEAKEKLDQQNIRIEEMKKLYENIENEADAQSFTEQISTMKKIREEALQEVANEDQGFSLFGWMFRWFAE
ncbi:MAG: hypothetical protein WC178_00965 [Candidatus Paceibacterota bacterium]